MKIHTLVYYKYEDLRQRLVELGVDDTYVLWDIMLNNVDFTNGCITYVYLGTDDEDYSETVDYYVDKCRVARTSVENALTAMNLLAVELQEPGIYVDFSW